MTGHERWQLTVHPDGSRTMASVVQYTPRDVQRHVIQRVGPNFEPIETYALYWVGGTWRGSALASVNGRGLSIVANTPRGPASQRFDVEGPLAIVPHVLAADSWRTKLYDRARGGTQPIQAYNFDATAEASNSLLGRMMSYRLAFVGAETLTVPAGRFETEHYRIEDAVDLYVSGEDGVLVRFVYPAIDREHELIEYRQQS